MNDAIIEDSSINKLKKIIQRSQHCQRNFDLSHRVPEEHIELLKVAATECPSKQNVAHYKLHFIEDPALISKVHELTPVSKAWNQSVQTTNSQVLSNLLVVFEKFRNITSEDDMFRNTQTERLYSDKIDCDESKAVLERDANVAIGIASGYLNLTASMLGYRTGCCQCMDKRAIADLLKLDEEPELLLGIGFKDSSRSRRIHVTDDSYLFPVRPKQAITVKYWREHKQALL